jgi:hypothetical protein
VKFVDTSWSDFFFKAGQERFEERVGDQIDHGLPRAGAGVF